MMRRTSAQYLASVPSPFQMQAACRHSSASGEPVLLNPAAAFQVCNHGGPESIS